METNCCSQFNPEPWQDKEMTWSDKLFVKARVRSFLHMPLNFGSVMSRLQKQIEAAGANDPYVIWMTDENSLWGADLYVSVSKEVPGAQAERLSGRFLTKVFEGSYKQVGQWVKTMKDWVAGKGQKVNKMYFYYTTCPKCAKVYGKNYVVLLARV